MVQILYSRQGIILCFRELLSSPLLLTMLPAFDITVFYDNCQGSTPPPHRHQHATWTTLAYKALIAIYYMFIYLVSSHYFDLFTCTYVLLSCPFYFPCPSVLYHTKFV
jgi:hypothetical protein